MLKLIMLRPLDINHTIDNRMIDMHALWPKLSCERLRQRSHRKLARCKGRTQCAAFHGRGCRGEDQGRRVFGGRDGVEEEWEDGLGEEEGAAPVWECVSQQCQSLCFLRCYDLANVLITKHNSPISFPARLKLPSTQLEERLPNESTTNIVNGSHNLALPNLLFQYLERIVYTRAVRGIGADPNGVAARLVDLVDHGLVVLGFAGEEGDGVGLCEFACYGGAAVVVLVVLYV